MSEQQDPKTTSIRQRTPFDPSAELLEKQREARARGRCGSLQTANGLPCERRPRLGFTVCRKHGERAPQTIARAERLLAIARMPAIEWILDALDQAAEETCETCGFPRHGLKEKKRLDSLAFKLLDRTGFGPRQTIDLSAKRPDNEVDVSSYLPEELEELDRVLALMDQLQGRVRSRLAHQAAEQIMSGTAEPKLLSSSQDVPGQSS